MNIYPVKISMAGQLIREGKNCNVTGEDIKYPELPLKNFASLAFPCLKNILTALKGKKYMYKRVEENGKEVKPPYKT